MIRKRADKMNDIFTLLQFLFFTKQRRDKKKWIPHASRIERISSFCEQNDNARVAGA